MMRKVWLLSFSIALLAALELRPMDEPPFGLLAPGYESSEMALVPLNPHDLDGFWTTLGAQPPTPPPPRLEPASPPPLPNVAPAQQPNTLTSVARSEESRFAQPLATPVFASPTPTQRLPNTTRRHTRLPKQPAQQKQLKLRGSYQALFAAFQSQRLANDEMQSRWNLGNFASAKNLLAQWKKEAEQEGESGEHLTAATMKRLLATTSKKLSTFLHSSSQFGAPEVRARMILVEDIPTFRGLLEGEQTNDSLFGLRQRFASGERITLLLNIADSQTQPYWVVTCVQKFLNGETQIFLWGPPSTQYQQIGNAFARLLLARSN